MSPSPKKRVVLLGATGFHGENTLSSDRRAPRPLELVGIAARGNWENRHPRPPFPACAGRALFEDAPNRAAKASVRRSRAGTQLHGGTRWALGPQPNARGRYRAQSPSSALAAAPSPSAALCTPA